MAIVTSPNESGILIIKEPMQQTEQIIAYANIRDLNKLLIQLLNETGIVEYEVKEDLN
jgi:hypothetical protein